MALLDRVNKVKDYLGIGTYDDGSGVHYGAESYGESYGAEENFMNENPNAIHSIVTIHPKSYEDVKSIGDAFRTGATTIVNLSELTEIECQRTVDFMSGLIYGLHGKIERTHTEVFTLTPSNINSISGPKSKDSNSEFYS